MSSNFLRSCFPGDLGGSILPSLFGGQNELPCSLVASFSIWIILCFLVLDSRTGLIAYSAMSAPLVVVGVFWSKFMPVNAMSLSSMTSAHTHSPQEIFTRGHRLQMTRIYASSVAAKMVNMAPRRNVISTKNKRHSMCGNRLSFVTKLSVSSSLINSRSPRPTGLFAVAGIAFAPKSFHDSILEWRKISV